jgi:hypothetical protein
MGSRRLVTTTDFGSSNIRYEIGNALGRLQADRPRLAAATEPGNMARLVTYVLHAVDVEAGTRFGLWSLDERCRYLRVATIFRRDGITLLMDSALRGSGGTSHTREPLGAKSKRREELLQIPAIMDLVQRVVLHANALLRERGLDATDLLPPVALRLKGLGITPIDFFTDEEP